MDFFYRIFFLFFAHFLFSQTNSEIPDLIPKMINGKYGYVNQKGSIVIEPKFDIALFFARDCNLTNSPNKAVKSFGSHVFATVEINKLSYRINKKGESIYQYKKSDLGKCKGEYTPNKFKAFALQGKYGLVSKENIDIGGYKDFDIYPQYQMLHVLDGKDPENPMMVAVMKNKFGVVDKTNKVIVPFIYNDIKTNLTWKSVNLFEVSLNGKDYFFIDRNNNKY